MNIEQSVKIFIGKTIVNFLNDNSNKSVKEKLITASINSIPDVINTIEFKNEIKTKIVEKDKKIVVAEFIDPSKNNW